ncbi:MAG: SpoIID/LytB domain-containing protein, partial [Acidobacteriota bacterium]
MAEAVLLAIVVVAAAAQTRTGVAPGATGPAYALIELPSGRVLAAARSDVLATRVLPGSVIKVATLIAAMEQGVVDDTTRILCQRVADVDGRTITCVHPDLHRPLGPEEALGLSCNVFFATIARRIGRAGFNDVLVRLGLPPADAGAPMVSAAVGLSGVRATPRALLNAFVRLTAPESVFRMADRTHDVLLAGLRLASSSGTASALGAAGFRALAKTGTAPMAGGGSLGLLVATVPDEHPRYGIVVLAPGGAGSDAAAIAADLLVRYGVEHGVGAANSRPDPATIRVGRARRTGGYDIQSLPIEEYVSQVVSGEMVPAAPVAALDALAIAVRTFAAANRDRHQADGFDLCDLTHCQVLGRATAETDRASAATRALVLFDGNSVAHVYFSAACGGYTDVPSHVWPGAADPAYLPARPDPACAGEVPWSAEIPEPQLRRVLQAAGLRGSGIREFKVASRHRSGRAASLEVAGMQPPTIDASLFRTFAGRVLGWNVVKSTMFDVRRSGAGYVLTGWGLGHGVGMCVRGSAERARGGAGRDAILSAYFPGLSVKTLPGILSAPIPKYAHVFRAGHPASHPNAAAASGA